MIKALLALFHPEPAQQGEGPRNCKRRVLLKEEAWTPIARSFAVCPTQDDKLSAGREWRARVGVLRQYFELAHQPKHFVALFDFFDR